MQPRHIKGALTAKKVAQALIIWLIREHNKQDVDKKTHQTVDWGRGIKADNVENYGHKGGHASNRVNL